MGGDEFAIVLPESTTVDAEGLFERLETTIGKRPVGQAGRLRLSAGVAELRGEDDAVSFFERADEALYEAKRSGKGRVVISRAVEEPPPPPASFPRPAS